MIKIFTIIFVLLIAIKSQGKIVVLEIDTGVDSNSHKELSSHIKENTSNENYKDLNDHGTHVAGLILKNTCSNVELISCSYYKNYHPFGSVKQYMDCLKLAVTLKPNLVNISAGGPNFDQFEFDAIKILSDQGTQIIVSAGNDNEDLKNADYYPAKYDIKNLIVVGSIGNNRKKSPKSNYGKSGMVWELGWNEFSTLPKGMFGFMSGTSMATANHTNRLLRKICQISK